ncbi:PLP-dependent aminotransferase family protein [Pseudomonas fuscovaginae UPB0736]|uniref:DNA-binding transcriptional regulator, MocR family, contains an aminotransferase domain n=1 Tax=Pseudomonas asplenii TaxID=53407 RepID=A0A1H1WFB5_9PSED|nr:MULTISPECIES: PLP-dependent aminotransferase family protein [Pseudomonas]UUQ64008.1 PLP-dependent aminotransferase family protein [Pseudomonas fuscovaginae UPB0736]SDS94849.1 DNA-binding transcriptional regulator, MocR family, contains an aminotransferase domain [Pseudomonas asplenii]
MDLEIDRQALVPVVQQIVNAIVEWIRLSRACPGTRLPSVRQLAKENCLSQTNVTEAYERLVMQGVLASRNGSVFIVAQTTGASRAVCEQEWYEGLEAKWGEFDEHPLGELKLGCGWIPQGWRESDDIGYAVREVSRTQMQGLFHYSTPLGLPALRQQLHKCLTQKGIQSVDGEVLTTLGVTQGLDLLVRTLLKPGDCVMVETPGYGNLYRLLQLQGIELLEVPRTRSGPDVEVLCNLLRTHRPKCLFVNSLCHNPTGSSLTLPVATQLLQLARSEDFLIIENGVCSDLQGGPGVQLAALDGEQRVIYLGGFSKTLSSSLKVGFIRAHAGLIQRLAEVKMITSLGASRFAECVVATLLANGAYRKLVQRLRQRLGTEMAATLDMLEESGWEVFSEPSAGMFVWARSRRYNAAQVQAGARQLGVLLAQDSAFTPRATSAGWLRINVAYATDSRAQKFFRLLGGAESTSTILKTTQI